MIGAHGVRLSVPGISSTDEPRIESHHQDTDMTHTISRELKMRALAVLTASITMAIISPKATADDMVVVPAARDLVWQMDSNGKIWLWNLHVFDSSFLPCCYKYYIDSTTPIGKTMWATVLAYIAQGDPRLVLHVSNKAQVSPITFVGN